MTLSAVTVTPDMMEVGRQVYRENGSTPLVLGRVYAAMRAIDPTYRALTSENSENDRHISRKVGETDDVSYENLADMIDELRGYADHDYGCSVASYPPDYCDCGFRNVLERSVNAAIKARRAKHTLPPSPERIHEIIKKHRTDISLAFVCELLPLLGMRMTAIADRNAKRQDRETGLGPKDESSGAEGNRP